MRSIYSYIFCLEILLLLYNLHIFASDQINEEGNNQKMFFSNFWETVVTNIYKKQLLTFLSNFWATFWEIRSNFLGNLKQLVESPTFWKKSFFFPAMFDETVWTSCGVAGFRVVQAGFRVLQYTCTPPFQLP